jgi:hypothetical protein
MYEGLRVYMEKCGDLELGNQLPILQDKTKDKTKVRLCGKRKAN